MSTRTYRKMSRRKKSQMIGLVFVTPWIFGFLAFKAIPLGMACVLSFEDYNIVSSPFFIGFENYWTAFHMDEFWQSAKVSFLYVLMTVPGKMLFSLFIAYLLSLNVKFIGAFRSVYYIPSLMGSSVAVAILWKFLFMTDGLLNRILGKMGLPLVGWLTGDYTALFVVSLQHVWQFGSTMVVFLAALKNVPQSLKEAARIDGAREWTIFWHVTVPYITPMVFFNLMTNLVTAFQEFNSPYVITGGGPNHATYLMSLMIYQNAFRYLKMGFASALSIMLFLTITTVTVLLFLSSKYWVNYQD